MASPTTKTLNILIAGAGIAGPSLALLLTHAGHTCTIVERAPDFRSSGQQIDVDGEALKVLHHAAVSAACWSRRVADDGIKFVDEDGAVQAAFGASSEGASLVKELEIMRPDLAEVFYERTKGRVEYVFNERVSGVEQDGEGVRVEFAGGKDAGRFDVLVAADGLRSSTRRLAFGEENTKIVTFNQYAGYFSIPWTESDGSWSRWFNATSGRTVSTRPNVKTRTTGAYLCQITPDAEKVATMPPEEQKQEIASRFADVGWETPRILNHLSSEAGAQFYCQEVAQAHSTHLVCRRVALLGDAGYCPSPISGQGSSLALIGSYILAGCLATHADDVEKALQEYERMIRPFAGVAQNFPPGVPWIVNPQTAVGIKVLNTTLGVADLVVRSGIGGLVSKVLAPVAGLVGRKQPVLPEFPAIHIEGDGA